MVSNFVCSLYSPIYFSLFSKKNSHFVYIRFAIIDVFFLCLAQSNFPSVCLLLLIAYLVQIYWIQKGKRKIDWATIETSKRWRKRLNNIYLTGDNSISVVLILDWQFGCRIRLHVCECFGKIVIFLFPANSKNYMTNLFMHTLETVILRQTVTNMATIKKTEQRSNKTITNCTLNMYIVLLRIKAHNKI